MRSNSLTDWIGSGGSSCAVYGTKPTPAPTCTGMGPTKIKHQSNPFRRDGASVLEMAAAAQPPIFLSTKPENVNPHRLIELYAACNYSCYRFPIANEVGVVEAVDPLKLDVALSHSSVMVSAFTRREEILTVHSQRSIVGGWIRGMGPSSPKDGHLIGFGRAVSDLGLTASIHDVVVHPALQGRGIGRKIVERIVWMLTNKFGIYDIAALCTDRERPFFRACGFGEDTLESTTMLYTRSVSSTEGDGQHKTVSAGSKILLVPPLSALPT